MDQAHTLEAFIEKLHDEGVEAGRQDGDELRAAAAAEAETLLEEAREAARRIESRAEARAEALLSEAASELALAVRDAQLELRARLEHGLTALLEERLEHPLEDPELLARLLAVVVEAGAAGGRGGTAEVQVRSDLVDRLAEAVPGMLGEALSGRSGIDLKGELRSAGFECRMGDAVVEVTPESVAETLARLVSPRLRDLVRSAASEAAASETQSSDPGRSAHPDSAPDNTNQSAVVTR